MRARHSRSRRARETSSRWCRWMARPWSAEAAPIRSRTSPRITRSSSRLPNRGRRTQARRKRARRKRGRGMQARWTQGRARSSTRAEARPRVAPWRRMRGRAARRLREGAAVTCLRDRRPRRRSSVCSGSSSSRAGARNRRSRFGNVAHSGDFGAPLASRGSELSSTARGLGGPPLIPGSPASAARNVHLRAPCSSSTRGERRTVARSPSCSRSSVGTTGSTS